MGSPRGKDLRQGEKFTLFASAVRATPAVGALGTAVFFGGERKRYVMLLDVTAAASIAADTLDIYVDWSIDNVIWFNGAHFTQILGNGGVKKFFTIFDPTGGLAADVDVTSDCAVHVTRPATFGAYMRGRYTLVSGEGTHSFTFSLTGYAL